MENFLDDPWDYMGKVRAETLERPPSGDRSHNIALALEKLRMLKKTLQMGAGKTVTMSDCVAIAFEVMHVLFRDGILDLVSKFPEDAKTERGDPFWTGHKKFPQALKFDPNNERHVDFVVATANLFACVLKVHPPKHPSECNKDQPERWMHQYRSHAWARQEVAKLAVPAYVPGVVGLVLCPNVVMRHACLAALIHLLLSPPHPPSPQTQATWTRTARRQRRHRAARTMWTARTRRSWRRC